MKLMHEPPKPKVDPEAKFNNIGKTTGVDGDIPIDDMNGGKNDIYLDDIQDMDVDEFFKRDNNYVNDEFNDTKS